MNTEEKITSFVLPNDEIKGGNEENVDNKEPDKKEEQQSSEEENTNLTALGIIYDVLKKQELSLKRCSSAQGQGDFHKQVGKDFYFAYNNSGNNADMVYTRNYNMIPDSNVVDYLYNLYYMNNVNRNVLSLNQFRSVIHANYFSNPNLTDENKEIIRKVLNLISCGVFHPRSENYEQYMPLLSYIQSHHNCVGYCKPISHVSYHDQKIKNKYTIYKLDRELGIKFTRIGRYFNEIKKMLEFNPENGYYSYKVVVNNRELLIPVVCKHEYMILEKVSLVKMAMECYRCGKCKYCGQDLLAYHEQVKESLPSKVYELIYKFNDCISENIDEESNTYLLFNMIYDTVRNQLKDVTVKNYEAFTVGIAAVFLYKVYIVSKERGITYNNKIGKFLDSVREYTTNVGWSQENVNEIINSDVFPNLDNIESMILENVISKNVIHSEILPISVMFGTPIAPGEKIDVKPKNKFQELWMKGQECVDKFNELIDRGMLARWKYGKIVELGHKSVNFNWKLKDIEPVIIKNGENFWNLSCKYYCPVFDGNTIHKFVKGVCSKCGLKSDFSNKDVVYEKHQNFINKSYVQIPYTIDNARFDIKKMWSVDDIKKYDGNALFDKFIKIENYSVQQFIDEDIKNKRHVAEYIKLISSLTTIDVDDIPNDPEFIKKALAFVVDKKIISSEGLSNELQFICLRIYDIQFVMML